MALKKGDRLGRYVPKGPGSFEREVYQLVDDPQINPYRDWITLRVKKI